ncbi:N-acetylmuramic acid 6-phosphate etherase [Streptococcus sp. zg-86]|uniref:N-acetylmuramic acid 6-phosphate etherase n=1 Tax=Streptococcus zhangguiae TaxID=2664091 RepID=A0A6I4RCH3_9STRE|nr:MULTISPECIES: N-acetylmuramic acid 6-phosphate etherase [unclassified Streptococcus]MTB64481.1 N-acetylmuramic acid 6-phosphate etherase [Streptococcus sp. zg-86]MTB90829.1 N-acetylmuramic acid 6-phosphate etherase [Streptococcus sp. zg-36]MWV56468.1 N-acetylmuramic acid 6-phosphate etherase [Streptococcus sp. zg-70]QTH47325.1 N-acetylmuramic acid 6-phosphate etherase [Streptococcus sp. zg-86]
MEIHALHTEQRNPASAAIEEMSVAALTAYINREDQTVAQAVAQVLPQVNLVIEQAVQCVRNQGRIFYIGAGTSGRLGILDASECPPTYGVSPELVQGIIAGGLPAILAAQEGAEDNQLAAEEDLQAHQLSAKDIVIGLAASGRTPYVLSGLAYAKKIGAKTASISCVKGAALSDFADIAIEVLVGPEVVAGSSRMKAGTAQKLILNMISTATMIQLGKVYKGYMVDVQPTNAKLIERAKRIIQQTTACSEEEAERVFAQSKQQVKKAILMQLGQLNLAEAESLLEAYQNHIVLAIRALGDKSSSK